MWSFVESVNSATPEKRSAREEQSPEASVTSSELEDMYRRLTTDADDAREASEVAVERCRRLEASLASREATIVELEAKVVGQWKHCRESRDLAAEASATLEARRRELDDSKAAAARAALDLAQARRAADAAQAALSAARVDHATLEERVRGVLERLRPSDDRRADTLRAQLARLQAARREAEIDAALHEHVYQAAAKDADTVVAAARTAIARLRDRL